MVREGECAPEGAGVSVSVQVSWDTARAERRMCVGLEKCEMRVGPLT
jgi:hypothetical protein